MHLHKLAKNVTPQAPHIKRDTDVRVCGELEMKKLRCSGAYTNICEHSDEFFRSESPKIGRFYPQAGALPKNKTSYLILNIICCLLAICLITSCGFTVRSKQSLPPQLHTIYFQADKPYGQLEVALKKEFKAARITLLDNPSQASIIFHLNPTIFSHSSDTKHGPSTQARIYHLTLATTFSITDARGKILFGPQNVDSIRDLTLNSNEIFDTSTEVDSTKQIMQHELIIKIFNLLGSQKVFQALQ